MQNSRISVLIVDDEPLARQRLSLMLTEHLDAEVVGEAATAMDAVRMVRELRPACVFLDVSMPGGSGFRLFEALPAGSRPLVVFVTAHSDFAKKAFDVDAVDYLLKPYDDERLGQSLEKVRRAMRVSESSELRNEIQALANSVAAVGSTPGSPVNAPRPTRFAVTIGSRTLLISANEITWIEAERNYVWLHRAGDRLLHRCGIGQMEQLLDPNVFVRTHRSAIVRVELVREIRTDASGESVAILADNTKVPVSARHRARLEGR